ncbi:MULTISPECIES: hypothetical protein [Microbacterium]|jgi:hypothetical protein|uniref:hypothetical protein n=1 Tax=Microbacterium TaxID=33882 RepID=UPI001D1785F3|nr:hypothetical protein [Microbacterium testaceum]MCC4248252.1 hypothetical protein [Microbacterium testaceum]
MRTLRTLAVAAALGLTTMLLVAPPATAAPAPATAANPVNGVSWSAPAYPVTCTAEAGQVSCTPDNPQDVRTAACFLGVPTSGSTATVCTTYEGHHDAIRAAGGKAIVVQYGCSVGDVVCITFENAGRGAALAATTVMHTVLTAMSFDTTTALWSAATGEWSFWAWAILMVLLGAMIWAITAAVVSRDRDALISAIIRSFLAIPAVPIGLWLTGLLLNAVDDMSWYILNRDGPGSLFSTLQSVMWAGGQANYFFAFLIHSLLMVAIFLLLVVFAFRNLALAALIAVAPIAWMIFPVRTLGAQWVIRYVSAVVALLLTTPLTIGFFALIVNGLANITTIWDPQSWPLLLGLLLVTFAPFAVFGLFSFIGGSAVDSIGSRMGSNAARSGTNTARTLTRIPTRVGSSPAGTRAPAGPGRAPSAAPASRASGTSARPPITANGSRPAPAPSRPGAPPAGTAAAGPTPRPSSPASAPSPSAAPAPTPPRRSS